MTMRRVAGLLLGLLAGLAAVPAEAAEPAITISVAQRWDTQAQAGAWSPYVVTVKDEGGSDFTGDIFLVPHQGKFNGPQTPWPTYQSRLTLGRGTQRSVYMYALEPPNGYRAEVHDLSGHVLAAAELQSLGRTGLAVGILSDDQSSDTILRNINVLQTQISATRFGSAQQFPNNAAFLTGLQAIVIDDFDTSSLSQAQVQALRDFVGFGGDLVVAGGASWRRSMLSLPPDLLPLKPTGTVSESLAPLADLGGRTTDLAASVASGDLLAGHSVLEGADRIPLVIANRYGAGEVVVLSYDPLADPIASDSVLAPMAWSPALARTLVNLQQRGFGPTVGVAPFQQAPGGAIAVPTKPLGPPAEYQIWQYLRDTPAAASPPVGLLGIVLIAYVLLVGPLTYLALKGLRRRELAWIAVPLIAGLVTFGSYGIGFGSRGGDFIDNEIELQRLAPTGDVMASSYHALFLPRRGNYTVEVPGNGLVTTGSDVLYGGLSGQTFSDSVVNGSRPQVLLRDVAVWSMRSLVTVSVARQPVALDAQVSMSHARLQGKLTNRGSKALQEVRFFNSNGEAATVPGEVQPGATVSIDTAFQSIPLYLQRAFQGQTTNLTAAEKREAMMLIASGGVVQRPGDIALVAATEALPPPAISGVSATRLTTALVVAPVRLQSADQLPGGLATPNLASAANAGANWVDVYDIELPAGVTQALTLRYVTPTLQNRGLQAAPGTVEVYDWSAGTWKALPVSSLRQGSVVLDAGERAGDVVRVRVRESQPINQAQLQIVSGTESG
jgi:hypothetical protein